MSEMQARATRDELSEAFGTALRGRRKASGITQEALAEAADVSGTYIAMLERGERSPSLYIVLTLADALGLDVLELVAETRQTLRDRTDKDKAV